MIFVGKTHERYKSKPIVFVNICVDASISDWKKCLSKFKLSGINLIAEAGMTSPVCESYNIDGIPQYFIIQKEGKLIDVNAPRPSARKALYDKLDNVVN